MKALKWLFIICLVLAPITAMANMSYFYEYFWGVSRYSAGGEVLWDLSQKWFSQFDSMCSTDAFVDMALDGSNNVYLLGNNDCTSKEKSDGLILAKIQANGQLAWRKETHAIPRPAAMVVDEAGNALIAGPEEAASPFPQLIKVDGQGDILWVASDDDSVGEGFVGTLLQDGDGNVIVVGSVAEKNSDIWLRKYSPTGAIIWTKTYGLPDVQEVARAAFVDEEGRIVIAGNATPNVFCLQFDAEGNLLWDNRYTADEKAQNLFFALQRDPVGYAYLIIRNLENNKGNAFNMFMKVAANGDTGTQQTLQSSFNTLLSAGIDQAGNLYFILEGIEEGMQLELVKYDDEQQKLLETVLTQIASYYRFISFAVNTDGEFVVIVETVQENLAVFRCAADGSSLWSKIFPDFADGIRYHAEPAFAAENDLVLAFDYWEEDYYGGGDTDYGDTDEIDDDDGGGIDDDYYDDDQAAQSDDDNDDNDGCGCIVSSADPAAPLVAVMLLIGLVAMAVSMRRR